MSSRTSSKQHGHANSDCQRPKSLVRKKMNKATARVARAEKQEKNTAVYNKAVEALKSEF